MSHYDWTCDGCDFSGEIRDASYTVTLNKAVTVPYTKGHEKTYVTFCQKCKDLITMNSGINLWNSGQYIDQSNVKTIT